MTFKKGESTTKDIPGAHIHEEHHTYYSDTDIRPELLNFCECMELILRRHDDKAHWRTLNYDQLFDQLYEELTELHRAMIELDMRPEIDLTTRKLALTNEALDLANICMMIRDKALIMLDYPDYRKVHHRQGRRFLK